MVKSHQIKFENARNPSDARHHCPNHTSVLMEVDCVFSLLAAKIDTGMHVLPALSDVVYHCPPSGIEELARSEMAWFYPRLVLFVLFFCFFFFFFFFFLLFFSFSFLFFFAAGDEDTLPSWECIKVIDTMKSAITRVRVSWLRRQRCYRGCVCRVSLPERQHDSPHPHPHHPIPENRRDREVRTPIILWGALEQSPGVWETSLWTKNTCDNSIRVSQFE